MQAKQVSTGGAANTAPGEASSSMPGPTAMMCAGSWPEPEPCTTETRLFLGRSARYSRLNSGTYLYLPGLARCTPSIISATNLLGSFRNLRIPHPYDFEFEGLTLGRLR